MKRGLIVRRRAETQALQARDWYESQLEGLGQRFVAELDHAARKAHENPEHYQIVHRDIRRVRLRRFPYAVFFPAEPTRDVVHAILSDPFSGIGKPESLKYLPSGTWTRRLTEEHRIVYLVGDGRIDFLQARYHY